MWNSHRYLILAAVLLAATAAESFADEATLLAVLRSDATLQEKSAACRELARVATKEAVPTLATLLGDEKLSHMARYALEAIPDPSVDEALREALGKVQGGPRLGVIGSLGVRRDAKAVPALAELLRQPDTAAAAARALGDIGNPEAAKALTSALAAASGTFQSALCEGLLRCAEALAADGQGAAAQAIYDRLRELADAPHHVRAAALRGAVLSRGKAGVPLLVEAFRGPDYSLAAAAARAAMELPAAEVADALLAELPKAPAERQGLLILALADRNERRVVPAVLQAATSSDAQLRIVAFRALKRVGDSSCVPALLDAAVTGDEEVSKAAMDTIESLEGKSVDDQLTASLTKAQGKMRMLLIDLVGRRRTASAVAPLWQAADDADPAVRALALASLGAVLEPADLPKLIARLGATKDDREAAALDKALVEACLRAADREAVAGQLAAALPAADGPVKARILATLTVIGSAKALETVAAAARSDDSSLRDAAFRELGRWKSVDAAPVLLDLHNAASDSRLKVRAIRAYIRIVRQFDMPADRRAEMCRTVLKVAERDEDKALVLEILLRYPSDEMQEIALEAAKIPALKEQALFVAMGMASKGTNRAELGKALAQAGQKPVNVEILRAEYGAGEKVKDVSAVLRKFVKNYRIIFLPDMNYNKSFGDPAPGVVKQLKIRYRIDGKEGEATFSENAMIVLPMPK
jgi:HEAT repeat protein